MNRLSKTLSRVLATPNNKSGKGRPSRPTRTGLLSRRRRLRVRNRVVPFRRRRPRTVSNPSWGRSLPAAYASHVRPRFNVSSRSATSARVAGCDLVYPIPDSISVDGANIFAVIPANPAYWTGTRIAQFAPAYMNYRPVSITFSYIPQVAVTQAGTVFMGTIWNGAAPASNIQQSLVSSNGGALTQCYVPCDSKINLGTNLQQNLFTMSGHIDPDSSPFLFLAGVRGADVVPGYFYVTYVYEFKNPLGQAWDYGRSQVLTGEDIPKISNYANSSLVLLSQSDSFGPGTVFDLEKDGVYYRGSPYVINPAAYVIQFYNQQSESFVTPSKLGTKLLVKYQDDTNDELYFSDFEYTSGGTVNGTDSTSTYLLVQIIERSGLYQIVARNKVGETTIDPCWVFLIKSRSEGDITLKSLQLLTENDNILIASGVNPATNIYQVSFTITSDMLNLWLLRKPYESASLRSVIPLPRKIAQTDEGISASSSSSLQ